MPDRDVEFVLGATDRTGPAAKSAASGFEKVDRSATGAQRAVDELGDQTGQLARKMLEARAAALDLARQFDKTGDAKILKDFEKINREAAKLARVGKSLKFDPPEVKNAAGFLGAIEKLAKKAGLVAGDAAIDGLGSLFNALPAQVKAGLIVGASAGAAYLAAATEGAILAGIGAGAIGGTVLIAAQNEKVKEQYSLLGQQIMASLKDASKPMVDQLLGAVPKFSSELEHDLPGIQRIMANASRDFAPVLNGLLAAFRQILPSIERAADIGGRILGNVGAQLPALAGAVGDLLNAFSDSGRGANAALLELVMNVRVLIEAMALLARAAAPALNTIGRVMELMDLVPSSSSALTTLATATDRASASAGMSASSYEDLSQSLGNTANMAKQLQANFDALFGAQMSVDEANLAVNLGTQQLTETIKGNKKSLDESTAAGAQNAQVILQQVQNLNAKREADIAAGNGTAEATAQANAAYASQLEGLRKLLYSLGLNHAEVDRLIGAYAALAQPQTKTFTTVYRTQGTPPGASDEKTGHSRTGTNDYSGLSGWAPAEFNARSGMQLAAATAEARPAAPMALPTQVHSEHTFNVLLDGVPFRAMAVRSVSAAEARQAWRNKTGRR